MFSNCPGLLITAGEIRPGARAKRWSCGALLEHGVLCCHGNTERSGPAAARGAGDLRSGAGRALSGGCGERRARLALCAVVSGWRLFPAYWTPPPGRVSRAAVRGRCSRRAATAAPPTPGASPPGLGLSNSLSNWWDHGALYWIIKSCLSPDLGPSERPRPSWRPPCTLQHDDWPLHAYITPASQYHGNSTSRISSSLAVRNKHRRTSS